MKAFRIATLVPALAGAFVLPGLAHAGPLSSLLSNGASVGVTANILNILGAMFGLSVTP